MREDSHERQLTSTLGSPFAQTATLLEVSFTISQPENMEPASETSRDKEMGGAWAGLNPDYWNLEPPKSEKRTEESLELLAEEIDERVKWLQSSIRGHLSRHSSRILTARARVCFTGRCASEENQTQKHSEVNGQPWDFLEEGRQEM